MIRDVMVMEAEPTHEHELSSAISYKKIKKSSIRCADALAGECDRRHSTILSRTSLAALFPSFPLPFTVLYRSPRRVGHLLINNYLRYIYAAVGGGRWLGLSALLALAT